jgi:hypothetical protein
MQLLIQYFRLQNIAKVIAWIIFGFVALSAENNVPRIPLNEYVVEANPEASTVWSLETIFASRKTKNAFISSYRIEGNSPCIIQDGDIFLKEYSSYLDDHRINDFDIIESTLYYLSEFKVYSIDIRKLITNEAVAKVEVERKKVLDIAPYNFSSMRVARFSNNELVFFFLGKGLELFYVPLNLLTNEPYPLSTTDIQLEEINEHTKIITYQDFIFIPSGKQGLLVYKYQTNKKLLQYVKKFDFTANVRDFSLLKMKNKVLGAIADYSKGLIIFEIQFPSVDTQNIQTFSGFIKIKSLELIKKKNKVKVLMLIDHERYTSKYTSITLNDNSGFTQDHTKILDGIANYIDSSNDNAVIVMGRSMLVMDIDKEMNNPEGSIWNQMISNAGIYSIKDHGELIFGVGDMRFFLTGIMHVKEYLMCNKEINPYNFTILGRSNDCSQIDSTQSCDYQVKAEYKKVEEQAEKEKEKKRKEEEEEEKKMVEEGFSGLSVLLLFLIVVLLTVILTLVVKGYIDKNGQSRKYDEIIKETGTARNIQHAGI